MFTISSFVILINLLTYGMSDSKLNVRDLDHMKSHLKGTIDISHLTQRELLFHYFQVHDNDDNNKLDGCEILQSVLHIYSEATANLGTGDKTFSDLELANIVDAFLERNDVNLDGFVDYSEFLNGEMSRAF